MKIQPQLNVAYQGRGASALSGEAIRNHYDGFAWAYRLYWGDHLHHGLFRSGKEKPREAQEALLRHCALRAGLRQGAHVLDAGCGYGGTARFLAQEYSCSVLGLTISQAQFKLASRLARSARGPGSVQFALADAEAYPLPPSSFDLVLNLESLGHFFHKAEYFLKVKSALKPGGRFLLADWTGSMNQPLVRQIAKAFLCPDLFTAEEYSQQLQSAGMTVISSEPLAHEVARTWDICAKRLRAASWLLALLPRRFRSFQKGVELMRQGFRSGQLDYTVLVAERPA
ncbi:MAG TPA: class I SAM-dependent methyltransferase [Candidatus Angelobacter sp.]|nr:class I SAM-dependent methyltransferase [Candidatus Angelobacter sp.]